MPSRSANQPKHALAFDPDWELAHELRMLLDARFLGALHADLREQLGPDPAASTLFQLGFLHGLRDAARALREESPGHAGDRAGVPSAPRLAMDLAPAEDGGVACSTALRGGWPEQHEAVARVARLGASAEPACHLSAGYTSGWLSGVLERDVLAFEVACAARGEDACRFEVQEASVWSRQVECAQRERARAFPFSPLRILVAREIEADAAVSAASSYDSETAAIHVWGPVMILPFAGVEESMEAVALIGRDPEVRQVSVVLLDLADAILDEAWGAMALERMLEAIEGWGAEAILTGVSPLSERVVADLEREHLIVRKDLPDAIAFAFQVAATQGRVL